MEPVGKAYYQLNYFTSTGEQLLTWVIDGFSSLQIVRRENEIGRCEVVLPYHLDKVFLDRDRILEVYRVPAYGGPMRLVGETLWFLEDWSFHGIEGEELTTKLVFSDAMVLVKRRFVDYVDDSDFTDKEEPADNVIKAIARENMGVLATDTSRNLSPWLIIELDRSLAPATAKQFSWRNLFEIFKEVCKNSFNAGTYLVFDVVRVGQAQVELRTYTGQRGQNHGIVGDNRVTFSTANQNLLNPELLFLNSNSYNYVKVGGQGEKDLRLTRTAIDTQVIGVSPWARTEIFIDARNTEEPAALQDEADTHLKAGRPLVQFNGGALDTPTMAFGRDFDYGDIVGVEYKGYWFDAHIEAFSLTVNRDGAENLDIRLKGETYAR